MRGFHSKRGNDSTHLARAGTRRTARAHDSSPHRNARVITLCARTRHAGGPARDPKRSGLASLLPRLKAKRFLRPPSPSLPPSHRIIQPRLRSRPTSSFHSAYLPARSPSSSPTFDWPPSTLGLVDRAGRWRHAQLYLLVPLNWPQLFLVQLIGSCRGMVQRSQKAPRRH